MADRAAVIDMVGRQCGRLLVLERAENVRGHAAWRCRCSCGGETVVVGNSLRAGRTTSCGCAVREIGRGRRHGLSRTSEHDIWWGIHERCRDKTDPKYGARGISVCDRWSGKDGFVHFLSDMGPRPSPKHSIDRVDNGGNYEPGNCRWATTTQQNQNKRNNVFVVLSGERVVLAEAARRIGIHRRTLRDRIKNGQTPDDVLRQTSERGHNDTV